MSFKKITAFGLAAALLAGCSSTTASSGTSGSSESASTEIVAAIDADLNTMDYHVATDGTSFIMQTMCISGLTQLDESGVPIPDMAESWEISDDGLTYTFHLREDAMWSDGTPVTAQDFVYGWQRLDDPELASEYAFLLSSCNVVNADEVFSGEKELSELGVEAADDHTFVVHLSLPCGFLLGLTAFPSFFPLNEAYYTSEGDQFALSTDDMIYNGPYEMTDWVAGNSYTFTKNDDYWNADEVKTETVTFKFIQDTQSAMLEYQSGNIDIVKLTGEQVDLYSGEEGFSNRLQAYGWRLEMNFNVEAISNYNLRKALGLAIDRETIAEDVLKDGSVAADGFIPESFAYDENGVDFRETAGKLTEYDPEAAAEYYAKAVEELGGDVTLELLFEDSEASKAVAENIQQMWQTNLPGITITLNSKPKKTRLELMNNLEYEIGLTRWGPDYADPQTFMDLYNSKTAAYNKSVFIDAYDELLEKAESGEDATDSAARWQDMIDAERILVVDEAAVIPVYQNGGAMMINPDITGLAFHSAGVDSYRYMSK